MHPGFTGSNSDEFFDQTVAVFSKYFGAHSLFGCAFSAKSIEHGTDGKKEIWNLNANAAPVKFKPNQAAMPEYARTTDQLLIIETKLNGTTSISIDLDPETIGPLKSSIWENDLGPGLEKKPSPVFAGIMSLGISPASEAPKAEWLGHTYLMDDPSKTPIDKVNCGSCHLSAAVRYRKAPDSIGPDFVYDSPSATDPESFGNTESAMHPKVLQLYKDQVRNKQWLPYHHGYVFGTTTPIVSSRHINEMFAVSKMVNLKNIKLPLDVDQVLSK